MDTNMTELENLRHELKVLQTEVSNTLSRINDLERENELINSKDKYLGRCFKSRYNEMDGDDDYSYYHITGIVDSGTLYSTRVCYRDGYAMLLCDFPTRKDNLSEEITKEEFLAKLDESEELLDKIRLELV